MARAAPRDWAPDVHTGTSGWAYGDWDGVFYPPGVTGAERLAYYARHFDAVEVNATFYRFPSAAMIAAWNRHLPRGFHLAVKAHRSITHYNRLSNVEELLARFLDAVAPLYCLRVLLWQLPPQMERDDGRLASFLALLPRDWRHAFEFRHASWWHPDVAALLARHGAAFVALSHPRLPGTLYPGPGFTYVRFHGLGPTLYLYDYSTRELRAWARRLRTQCAGKPLYAFFNNDYRAYAVGNALTLRRMLAGT